MLDFATVLQFSHSHCLAICAVLVPLNLLATLQTLILVGREQPRRFIQGSAALALLLATVLVLHVLSWLVVGVIMAPTYILFLLGSVCWVLNSWAIGHSASLASLLQKLVKMAYSGLAVLPRPS